MKYNTLVILAAVLFCTLAASCGKKTDSDMKTDSSAMPKMSMAMADAFTSNISVSLAPSSASGITKGVRVIANNDTSVHSASFVANNSSSPKSTSYQYKANYGGSSTTSGSDSSGSTSNSGTSSWNEGKIPNMMPVFWYPQFRSAGTAAWTNYDSDSVSTVLAGTAYFMSTGTPAANIVVTITGGGGGPK